MVGADTVIVDTQEAGGVVQLQTVLVWSTSSHPQCPGQTRPPTSLVLQVPVIWPPQSPFAGNISRLFIVKIFYSYQA